MGCVDVSTSGKDTNANLSHEIVLTSFKEVLERSVQRLRLCAGRSVSGQGRLGGAPGDGVDSARSGHRAERMHAGRPGGSPHGADREAHLLCRGYLVRAPRGIPLLLTHRISVVFPFGVDQESQDTPAGPGGSGKSSSRDPFAFDSSGLGCVSFGCGPRR